MYLPEKFLNKKIIVIFALILVAGGIFYWQYANKEIKGSPDDYEITETAEGTFVENKKAGLFVKAPERWDAQKIEFFEGSIAFYTPDIDGKIEDNIIKSPLNKGCAIGGAVIYKKMDFNKIKEEIKEIHAGLGIFSEEFEIITINNQEVLKNTFDSKFIGPSIGIYFLGEDKTYSFALYWNSDEKERCVQEFDKFLETVSIYSD